MEQETAGFIADEMDGLITGALGIQYGSEREVISVASRQARAVRVVLEVVPQIPERGFRIQYNVKEGHVYFEANPAMIARSGQGEIAPAFLINVVTEAAAMAVTMAERGDMAFVNAVAKQIRPQVLRAYFGERESSAS